MPLLQFENVKVALYLTFPIYKNETLLRYLFNSKIIKKRTLIISEDCTTFVKNYLPRFQP